METKKIALGITLLLIIPPEGGLAQSSDTNLVKDFYPSAFNTEEEIWEFLETLCQERPTRRCEIDQMARVRNGEILPVPTYDVEKAYRTRNEMIDQVLAEKELRAGDG